MTDVHEVSRIQRFEPLAFFTADHAEVANGKLYVNGGFWNRLNLPSYPMVLPPIAVVAVLQVPFSEFQAEHKFSLHIENMDREAVTGFRAEGEFRVSPDMMSRLGEAGVVPIVVPVVGLLLPSPTTYVFVLEVDGKELARHLVYAVQVPVPLQFQGVKPPDTAAG